MDRNTDLWNKMKKVLLVLLVLSISASFSFQSPVSAVEYASASEYSPLGIIKLPGFLSWTKAHPGISGINLLINNLVKMIFIIASVGLFIMFLYGGLRFILSQGDKAQTEAARNIITYAVIGFAIVALSFALVRIIETFFGISIISWPPGRTDSNPCPPDGFNLGDHAFCRTECENGGIGHCEGTWCCPD